jgi:aminopeptidase
MNPILDKYAHLLVHYCLSIKEGDRFFIQSTTLAEPLVRAVYEVAIEAGALVDVSLSFREANRILLEKGNESQLKHISPLYQQAIEAYDAYLYIRAPFNLKEEQQVPPENRKIRQEAHAKTLDTYFKRTAALDLRRNLCQYPTQANAQEAGMSLAAYEHFIFDACRLFDEAPIESWQNVGKQQQQIVDLLNQRSQIHYKGPGVDIQFSTSGRTWINSDGKTNMPSGEVYTSPVEDSVNGVIEFSYPAIYMGHEVEGVRLFVEQGYITKWEARKGKQFLDDIFQIEGTRRFGEAAIGTNYKINRLTKNILFDEKIGGTIHMAVGQSYLQTGGKNKSTVHWDMITDMKDGGEIFADGEKIYENGHFLFVN